MNPVKNFVRAWDLFSVFFLVLGLAYLAIASVLLFLMGTSESQGDILLKTILFILIAICFQVFKIGILLEAKKTFQEKTIGDEVEEL